MTISNVCPTLIWKFYTLMLALESRCILLSLLRELNNLVAYSKWNSDIYRRNVFQCCQVKIYYASGII